MEEINLQIGNSQQHPSVEETIFITLKALTRDSVTLSHPETRYRKGEMQCPTCPRNPAFPLLIASHALQGTARSPRNKYKNRRKVGSWPIFPTSVLQLQNSGEVQESPRPKSGWVHKTILHLYQVSSSQLILLCISQWLSFSICKTRWSQDAEELILADFRNLPKISQYGICHCDSWLCEDLWHWSHGSWLMSLPGV